MNEPSIKAACPSTEQLSEYVDGNVTEEIRSHLAGCADCRRIVEIYSMMDDSIATLSTPPEDFGARISLYCHHRAAAETPMVTVRSWQRLLRYAAAISLVGAVGAFIYASFPHGTTTPQGTAPVANNKQDPSVVPLITTGSATTLVGTPKPVLDSDAAAALRLPDAVHHVWYASNLEKAKLNLAKIAGTATLAETNDPVAKRYTVTLTIKDEALQSLVSKFAETGSQLLTPEYPQPEATDARIEFNGHPISYTMDIVYDL
jgi:hypothetical protein